MDALMKRQDYNLDMYKKLMSTHHKLLLTSQSILQMLLTIGACTPVHASRCSDQRVACEEILSDYLMQLKKGKYSTAKEQDFYSMFVVTEKTATYTKNILIRGMDWNLTEVITIVNGGITMIYT
jgi:hypothetical protein